MRGYEEFFEEIQMLVQCNTDTVMAVACRKAARDFFEQTQVWKYTALAIKEREGRSLYELSIPEETEVTGVRSMLRDGQLMTSEGIETVLSTATATGSPTQYYRQGLSLQLNKSPSDLKIIQPILILKPSYDSAGIEDDSYADRFRDTIISGSIGYLLAMPHKMWSMPQLAPMHFAKFNEGIIEARRETLGYTDGRPQEVEYPYSTREFTTTGRRGGNRGGY